MTTFEIREATADDADLVHAFMIDVVSERLPVLFERATPPTLEDSREFLRRTHSGGGVVFAAFSDQRVVGILDFHREQRAQSAHGGQFGMSVLRDRRGSGVGTALLESLLDWVQGRELARVELQVFENNTTAIRLYERLCFEHEGRRRKAVVVNGQRIDVLIMARLFDSAD